MPHSRPDAATLLRVALDVLEAQVYPTLEGATRYQTRVALNVLGTVLRELTLGPSLASEEAADLRAVLGEGPAATDATELARQITAGERDLDDPALRALLARSLGRALAINNPRWTRDERAPEEKP